MSNSELYGCYALCTAVAGVVLLLDRIRVMSRLRSEPQLKMSAFAQLSSSQAGIAVAIICFAGTIWLFKQAQSAEREQRDSESKARLEQVKYAFEQEQKRIDALIQSKQR